MTTTAVATRDDGYFAPTVLSNEQLQYISNTEFVPKGLRNNLPAILACVATGRALGIDDMTAIRQIHIIDGKPTFAAELMVMLVRRRGHSITGTVDAESATVTGTRVDNGDTMTSAWSLEMAKRAGLLGKGNWKNYPEAMLWARAVSQLCRMLFADCFAGGTYTTEELGDETYTAPERDTLEHPEGEPVDDGKFPPPDDVTLPPVAVISDAQRRRLRAIQNQAGVTDDALKALVVEIAGVESTKLIPAVRYDALVAAVEAAGGSGFAIPESARQ